MWRSLSLILVLACGGGDSDLDPDVVTSLPPGDATGAAASGDWQLASITTVCAGECTTTVDGFMLSACDIGTRMEDDALFTQQDGALTIDIDGSDYVSRLEGGIDADGAFDVGGLVTQNGGQVRITSRSQGTIAGTTLTGAARLLVVGMGFDCLIEADVDGTRD